MKTLKHGIIGIAVLVVLTFAFTACDEVKRINDALQLINKDGEYWVSTDPSPKSALSLKSDGTLVMIWEDFPGMWTDTIPGISLSGTYIIESGNTLSITMTMTTTVLVEPITNTTTTTGTFYMSNDGNSMTFKVEGEPSSNFRRESVSLGVFTPPSSHTQLTQRQWKDGSISSAGSGRLYSIPVTAGSTYGVWWKSIWSGYDSTDPDAAEVTVRAYDSSGTKLFDDYTVWYDPKTFTASSTGTVYIWVIVDGGRQPGKFPIVYLSDNNSPNPTFYRYSELDEWLSEQPNNTAANPYVINFNTTNINNSFTNTLRGQEIKDKYISLNLSGSIFTGTGGGDIFDAGFDGCYTLTSIILPNSLTSIGIEAFRGCSSLTGITIPASVKSIGRSAFTNCSSLTSVKFEGTIPSSGFDEDAFSAIGDLRNVFYATDSTNGTPGTYIVEGGTTTNQAWAKQ
jgi:hypothetical protein